MNVFPDKIMQEMGSETPRIFLAVEIMYKSQPVRVHTGVGTFVIGDHEYKGVGGLGGIEPIQQSSDNDIKKLRLSMSGLDPTYTAYVINERSQGCRCRVIICSYETVEWSDEKSQQYTSMFTNNPLYHLANNNLDVLISRLNSIVGESSKLGLLSTDDASWKIGQKSNFSFPEIVSHDYEITAAAEVFAGFVSTQAIEYGESLTVMIEVVDEFSILDRTGTKRYDNTSHQQEFAGDAFFELTGISSELPIYWGSKKDGPSMRQL